MNQPNASLDYYANDRTDVREFLSGRFARSLDVGCGAGAVSASLKREGIVQVAEGVELFPKAAERAQSVLDRVYRVDLSHSAEGIPPRSYDLVLCLDVLEHMVDPWQALRRIHSLLRPDGLLVVSLPNVRNFRVLLPLLLQGRWDYTDSGLLDRTHLRFFTKATAVELLEGAGFEIERSISPSLKKGSRGAWANALTLGCCRELLEFQYFFFARLRKNAGAPA